MIDEVRKQLVLDYQQTFGADAGQRVYDHLAEMLYYNASFIPVMVGTPQQVAFELGKREAFIEIKRMIEADPDKELQESADE